MKKVYIAVLMAVLGAFSARAIENDSAITVEKLPSGLSYYIAENQFEKSTASFALATPVTPAINYIDSLSRISSPCRFLERNGISPRMETKPEGLVYTFEGINTCRGDLIDSTLLVIFNILADIPGPCYSDYAVIVSGDVKKAAIQEKIKIFSLMLLPANGQAAPRISHEFKPQEKTIINVEAGNENSISYSFIAPRLDPANTSDIVNLFHERLNIEAGYLIKKRLEKDLAEKGIPFKSIAGQYTYSGETLSDEILTFKITAQNSASLIAINNLVANELASFGVKDFEDWEMYLAERSYIQNLLQKDNLANKAYIENCANNFLCQGKINSPAAIRKYLSSKVIEPDVHNQALKEHIHEILKVNERLTITVNTSSSQITSEKIANSFSSGWVQMHILDHQMANPIDQTIELNAKSYLMALRTDGFFQGPIFMTKNGVEISYKPLKSARNYHFIYAIPNDIFTCDDVPQGCLGFIPDYVLRNCSDYLLKHNLRLSAEITEKEFRFKGSAPKEQLDSLLMLISCLTSNYKVDETELDYFKDCIKGPDPIRASLDSLLLPSYEYSPCRQPANIANLDSKFLKKYLYKLCAHRHQGKVVMVGPEAEDKAGKTVGVSFSAITNLHLEEEKAKGVKPSYKYTRSAYVDRGGETLAFVLSEKVELTSDGYFLLQVANRVMRQEIDKLLSASPYKADYEFVLSSYPESRGFFYCYITKCDENVVCDKKKDLTLQQVKDRVSELLAELSSSPLPASELAPVKKQMISQMTGREAFPDFWIEAMDFRRLEKKNIKSGIDVKIKAVTPEALRDFYGKKSNEVYLIQ